jgi:hypothetical protein
VSVSSLSSTSFPSSTSPRELASTCTPPPLSLVIVEHLRSNIRCAKRNELWLTSPPGQLWRDT